LQIAIAFRFMFSYDDCVHNWLPCSIWIQPLPKRGSNQCGRFRHWSSAEQRTEPQVCATRLHSDDNPTSSLGASPTFSLREMFVDEPLSFDDILARRKVLEARIDAMAKSLPGAQPSGRYA
jgi:hypothetical protein